MGKMNGVGLQKIIRKEWSISSGGISFSVGMGQQVRVWKDRRSLFQCDQCQKSTMG